MQVRLALASLALSLCAACSTVQGVTRLDSMTDIEFSSYTARAAEQVAILAEAAVEEGDLTPETVLKVAAVLHNVAETKTIVSVLSTLDLEGYAGAGLVLGVMALEDGFEARGAYDENGFLNERGLAVIEAVATRLDAVASG